MARNERVRKIHKVEKEINQLNKNANDILNDMSDDITGVDYKHEYRLKNIDNDVDNILYNELRKITDHTGDDITKFLIKLYNDYDFQHEGGGGPKQYKTIDDIFASDQSSMLNFFRERYKNKWFLYDDLKLLMDQLFELREAVYATRDAIVTADDLSELVSRQLNFEGMQEDAVDINALETVKHIEKEFKLNNKIKNHLIPKTLQYGQYYVYTVPYYRILDKHSERGLDRDAYGKDPAEYNEKNVIHTESVTEAEVDHMIDRSSILREAFSAQVNRKDVANYMNSIIDQIVVENDPVMITYEATMDELNLLMNKDNMIKVSDRTIKDGNKSKSNRFFTDGTAVGNDKSFKPGQFSDVKGCYIRLISPKQMIPIKIMNQQTIGYYYIHEDVDSILSGPQMQSQLNPSFASMVDGSNNKQNLEKELVGKITDKIIKSFDKKFLENNSEFKELIVNALLFDDLYKRNIRFQFIEKDFITEFNINEDEDGVGKSILDDSIFYGKLYLALLLFKMITIIGKSNDTRVYYVKTSTVDKDVAGKIQEVARSVRAREMNFTDLMNYNTMVTKVGAGKSVFVPVGRSGERAFDPEIISGQQVELHSELMEFLRSNMITATGVPSVFLQHINEVDYSRTLVMMNNKFTNKVINLQLDFNLGITEVYKKLLRFATDIDSELIEQFTYKLNPPKAQNNTATTDQISNSEATAAFMVDTHYGKETELTDDDRRVKDKVYKELVKELQPSLPWDLLESIKKKAEINIERDKLKVAQQASGDNSGGDMGGEY